MYFHGKRQGRTLEADGVAGLESNRLFYVTDRTTKVRYLVDTGAEICVVPPTLEDRRHRQDTPPLHAVNGSPIKTYGQKSITLDIGLRRTFRWVFLIADVLQPIIGADFLRHFALMVDVKRRLLHDIETRLTVQGISAKGVQEAPSLPQVEPTSQWTDILNEFPDVFRPTSRDLPVKHTVTHHIETKGPPVFARPRRLAPDRLRIAKQEFEHMLELGYVRLS